MQPIAAPDDCAIWISRLWRKINGRFGGKKMTAKLVVPGSETLDQASNDVALTTANASFAIDVVANDRGGSARHLYSLDQTNPSAIQTFAQSKLGAAIKIIDGQVLYDPIASATLKL